MTEDEREYALDLWQARRLPWHSPPHLDFAGQHQYLVSASCYEHAHVIGKDAQRMTECEATLLDTCKPLVTNLYAWCVLPNHYHILLRTERIKELRETLVSSMEVPRMNGMAKTTNVGAKFGTTVLSDPWNQSVTFGQVWIMFIIILYITVMWSIGRIGHGRARGNSWTKWGMRKLSRYGCDTQFWTMGRNGIYSDAQLEMTAICN